MIGETLPPELLCAYEAVCHRAPIGTKVPASWRLPSFQKLYGKKSGTAAYMAWDVHALYFRFDVETDQICASYPAIEKGDAIELFIDTRNVKTARSTHRFYHHFFFLPERIEGVQCGEITRFRTQDRHPMARQTDLSIHVERTQKGYTASIEVLAECLHGYHPEVGERIGFYYRVHRHGADVDEWAFSNPQSGLHQHPHLFPTLLLQE